MAYRRGRKKGMTVKVLHKGLDYHVIPIEYQERAGESKLSAIKDGYRYSF